MKGKRSRLALAGVLAVVGCLCIAAGGGAQAADQQTAQAAKPKKPKKPKKPESKKGDNKVQVFKNGSQLLIPDDLPGATFPGQLDARMKVGRRLKGKQVADVDVSVRITHPSTADLDMFLIAPNGATVGLASDNGGQAGNTGYGIGAADCDGAATTFNDETFNFLSNAAIINEPGEILSPWAANVEPQGFPAPLNIVDGSKPGGTWTLRILDDTDGGVGTLHCWKLKIKPRSP